MQSALKSGKNIVKMKDFWITNSRFRIIIIVLIIMWLGLMLLFYLKADEVTKHPCSICANKTNELVTCYMGDTIQIQRIYYPNFSIEDKIP